MSCRLKLYLSMISIIILTYLVCYHVISLYTYSNAAVLLILPIFMTIYYLIICLLHKCENDINNKKE